MADRWALLAPYGAGPEDLENKHSKRTSVPIAATTNEKGGRAGGEAGGDGGGGREPLSRGGGGKDFERVLRRQGVQHWGEGGVDTRHTLVGVLWVSCVHTPFPPSPTTTR